MTVYRARRTNDGRTGGKLQPQEHSRTWVSGADDGHGEASASDRKTRHGSDVVDTEARITGARRPNKIVKSRNGETE